MLDKKSFLQGCPKATKLLSQRVLTLIPAVQHVLLLKIHVRGDREIQHPKSPRQKKFCQSDPNVVSSHVVSNKSLRLNLSQEVVSSTLLQSPRIAFPASAEVNTSCSSPFITEGSGRIGVSASNTCKRRQRNVASEESPSKRFS